MKWVGLWKRLGGELHFLVSFFDSPFSFRDWTWLIDKMGPVDWTQLLLETNVFQGKHVVQVAKVIKIGSSTRKPLAQSGNVGMRY